MSFTPIQELPSEETSRFNILITDSRTLPDAGQQFALNERLKTDHIDVHLQEIKSFLGQYSARDIEPKDISITIVEGGINEIADGQVKHGFIELKMAPMEAAIQQYYDLMKEVNPKITKENVRDIIIASCASTCLHEGQHELTDSKPGSDLDKVIKTELLSQDVHEETISQLEQIAKQDITTLIDEGLTYASQSIFAPNVAGINLRPDLRPVDPPYVAIRKKLGIRIEEKVKEYLDASKSIDHELIFFIVSQIKNLATKLDD